MHFLSITFILSALLHAPLQARFVEIKASMLKLFQYITKNDIKVSHHGKFIYISHSLFPVGIVFLSLS